MVTAALKRERAELAARIEQIEQALEALEHPRTRSASAKPTRRPRSTPRAPESTTRVPDGRAEWREWFRSLEKLQKPCVAALATFEPGELVSPGTVADRLGWDKKSPRAAVSTTLTRLAGRKLIDRPNPDELLFRLLPAAHEALADQEFVKEVLTAQV